MHLNLDQPIYSAGSFAQAPPDLWERAVPGPKLVDDGGSTSWVLDGASCPVEISERVVGDLGRGDVRATCAVLSDVAGRLEFQDGDSLAGEVLLPDPAAMKVLLAGRASSAAAISHYNEWIASFCADLPQRLVPVGQIPTNDLAAATSELSRCISLGIRAVAIAELPGQTEEERFPEAARDWWNQASDSGVRIMLPPSFSTGFVPVRGVVTAGRAPDMGSIVNELPISGVLDDNPGLRLVIVNGEPGWLPSAFDHADNLYMRSVATRPKSLRRDELLPSDYIRRFCWFTFTTDRTAVLNRDYIGEHHLMWSAIAPTESGRWPHDVQEIARVTIDTPDEARSRVLSINTRRFFGLDGVDDFTEEEIAEFRTVVLL